MAFFTVFHVIVALDTDSSINATAVCVRCTEFIFVFKNDGFLSINVILERFHEELMPLA